MPGGGRSVASGMFSNEPPFPPGCPQVRPLTSCAVARERVKYRQLWNRSKQSFDRIKTSRTFRIFLFWLFEFYGAFFPLPAISIFVSRKTAWLLSPVPAVVAAPVLLLLERGEEIALFSCNSVVVFCNGCFLSELFLRDPLDEVVEELLEGMAVEPT